MIALPGVAIQRKIYESSASLVYRGTREADGRAIIIKLLKQDYPSPQELTRYKQEYAITRSLDLEGVIKAYSQQGYQRALVMILEDFGGESLEYWMRQKPDFCPMPLDSFLKLAIDLTDILGRIHAAHIIHKDINPSNIVLNLETGVVKIIDFGIATQFSRANPTFKSPHGLEGTLAYLSPEQTGRMNRLLDCRTDFYSLGVSFYELLTGQLPFPTTDILELVHCHIAKQPAPPHEVGGVECGMRGVGNGSSSSHIIPKAVSDIVMKLMAKNAEDRYQSAWGIKADLEACSQQLETIGRVDQMQLGLQDVSDKFYIPQKLYGREAEIAALLATFKRVAGSEGVGDLTPSPHREMLLVSGYAGIGKTALVQELYKPITAKLGYFVSGKFDQLQRNIPYSAIVDALQKLVQQLLGEPDDQLQQWRSQLLTALGSNGQIMIDVIPEVELIIGKQSPVAEVGSTEAQNRFNLIFQQFIRVFCSKQHPLVIFLDDLQWIDSATLKLIELMMLDEQTQFLFLIGAYRDNEVSPTHPLALTLEGLQNQGAVLHQIVLSPLTLEPLSKLIAEAIHRDAYTVLPLAELVLRKTGGNPFLVCEVLRSLYSENLLRFDADRLSWRWNLDQIRAANITDNVVELLLNKLKKLPEVTQQLLQLAACIGAEFDLKTLAIVCEQSPKAVFRNLLAAIQAGLIQPLSELDEDLLVQDYKFLHDRVQQAAYALINEEHKKAVHFQIGRLLLTNLDSRQLSKRLFEVVDHLNNGRESIGKPSARIELVKLNLEAGKKAKAATAYLAALQYLMVSTELTTEQIWDSDYELAFELYTERACVEYLNGHFDRSEKLINLAVKRAKTASEKAEIYNILIVQLTLSAKYAEAIQTGRHALSLIDIHLPETDFETARGLEMAAVDRHLAGRAISSLFELPYMNDPEKKVAIKLLTTMGPPTYRSHPKLWSVICSKAVNLCLQYGNVSQVAYSYTSYGGLLGYVLNEYQAGEEFGKLALKLSHKFNNPSDLSVAYLMIGSSLKHWSKHLKYATEDYQQAYNAGWESGNLQYAAYAFGHNMYCRFYQGINLEQLLTEISDYISFSRSSKNQWAIDLLLGNQILIGNLIGITSSWSDFCHEEIPEKQYLERFLISVGQFPAALQRKMQG